MRANSAVSQYNKMNHEDTVSDEHQQDALHRALTAMSSPDTSDAAPKLETSSPTLSAPPAPPSLPALPSARSGAPGIPGLASSGHHFFPSLMSHIGMHSGGSLNKRKF